MALTIATAMLIAAGWRVRNARIRPLEQKELVRYRRDWEQKSRDWMYPFE